MSRVCELFLHAGGAEGTNGCTRTVKLQGQFGLMVASLLENEEEEKKIKPQYSSGKICNCSPTFGFVI